MTLKRFALTLALVAIAVGCMYTPPADPPADFHLSYLYERGPVSPEYQFEYRITIDANGAGTIAFKGGDEHVPSSWEDAFQLTEDAFESLWREIADRRILSRRWRAADESDMPDGGDWSLIEIRADDREIEAPAYLANRDHELAQAAIEAKIHELLPDELLRRLPPVIQARYER